MFTILGGDGKEYGPASVEQLRGWIAAGRANLDTKARAVGSEEWRRLGDYPEFAPAVGAPPMMTAAVPAYATTVTPATTGPGGELAGVGARIGAALINAFLYFVTLMIGSLLGFFALMRSNPDLDLQDFAERQYQMDEASMTLMLGWIGAAMLAVLLVQGILLGWRGQNLGKMMLGLRVVRVDGQPAGFLRAAGLRLFLPVMIMNLPYIGLLFFLVDFCFIFRGDRRCLHDLIAGTKVVKN